MSHMSRTATVVPHSVNVECANCRTPIYEGVIAADTVPWRSVVICENCGRPARIPASPFASPFFGANAVSGK